MFELRTTHAVSDAELTVHLAVTNGTAEPVYVPVLPVDADFGMYPGSAYVHLTADELAICLMLGPSLIPTGRAVEMKMSALYRPVAPGHRFEHTLRFPLPVREWCAYLLPAPPDPAAGPILAYQAHLFFHPVRESAVQFRTPVPGHHGLFQVGKKKDELIRDTITLDRPVPVVKHPHRAFPRM